MWKTVARTKPNAVIERLLEEGDEQEQGGGEGGAEFLEGEVEMILDGLLLDVKEGGDLIVGAMLNTTHYEYLAALLGHTAHHGGDECLLVFHVDDILDHLVIRDVGQDGADVGLVLLDEVDGLVEAHPVQVEAQGCDVREGGAHQPEFDEYFLGDIGSILLDLKEAFHEAEDHRVVVVKKLAERTAVAFGGAFHQESFLAFCQHILLYETKL